MDHSKHHHDDGSACCSCNRREFLASVGLGSAIFSGLTWSSVASAMPEPPKVTSGPAKVRVAFLYPPSRVFADNPDGWWSWPGNEFDAEGRQQEYTAELQDRADRMGVELDFVEGSIGNAADAERFAASLKEDRPDGVVLIMFFNNSLPQADQILEIAEEAGIPAVFFIGLGVKHGAVGHYRRPGIYLIQSLDNLDAIEYGIRMIHAKKRMGQATVLSITGDDPVREAQEGFFGTTVRVLPFRRYADLFEHVSIDDAFRSFSETWRSGATEIRGLTAEAHENAARAHFALRQLLAEEEADAVAMNCLREGMLKPCLSFAALNDALIPAACENDLPAAYTQLLGQLLVQRPGFMHNPAFETERNHYYGSHCTCPTRLHGPEGPQESYLLRRFAHSNEGSCALQVFFTPGEPVTMMRYYPGEEPMLDVYAGRVVESHPMPPAAGCTTNVELEITDRADACMVRGHHNLIFCGDYARKFRMFTHLHKMALFDSGFEGPWPI